MGWQQSRVGAAVNRFFIIRMKNRVLVKLQSLFMAPPVYVQVFRNRFVVSLLASGVRVEGTGDFSHPRMLIGKFQAAEQLLRQLLQEAYEEAHGKSVFPQRPLVVVHPKEVLEGGLTDIEERVLMEMALGAGARRVKVWQGDDLRVETMAAVTF